VGLQRSIYSGLRRPLNTPHNASSRPPRKPRVGGPPRFPPLLRAAGRCRPEKSQQLMRARCPCTAPRASYLAAMLPHEGTCRLFSHASLFKSLSSLEVTCFPFLSHLLSTLPPATIVATTFAAHPSGTPTTLSSRLSTLPPEPHPRTISYSWL